MLRICVLIYLAALTVANFEGFIVGGSLASITDFPHAAFIVVSCVTEKLENYTFGCGSSILNQQLLLTAAHCLIECTHVTTSITINLGDENKLHGVRRYASSFVCHENYDPNTSGWDIAIVRMSKPVQFGTKISRVAIMQSPPYNEPARLAGWGMIEEISNTNGFELKQINQIVWERRSCINLLKTIPKGTFCAYSDVEVNYPARGDSGSGLVVRGYIQIGLVSYKRPAIAKNVIVYTDIGYHYTWIEFNAGRLCETCLN